MAERLRINGRNWKNWLQVKRSNFPGAGRGLFALKDIPAKTLLGKYQGRRITTLKGVHELKDDRYLTAISLPNRRLFWLDGNVPSNYLRFVNGTKTPADRQHENVEAYQYGGTLRFRALRPIRAGEELVMDYCEEFWETYSSTDGIKHRNDELLRELETEIERSDDARLRAAFRGIVWLLEQMSSVTAYSSFFTEYLWMLYDFRLSKRNPKIVAITTKILSFELDGAQFRLGKIFKPNLADKWLFIRLIPILYATESDTREYAKFYRSYFPRSLEYFDVSFNDCMRNQDFEGAVDVLSDYCILEMAHRSNRYSRIFRLPASRFSDYWRAIKQYDVGALEASVTNDDEQFDLDYQLTHLVMCRYGYGSSVFAPKSKFDAQLAAYLARHENRILEDSDDLDLICVLTYCYLKMKVRKDWIRKAIRKILASQNADGSWGAKDQMRLNMYDRSHATWTAVSALCHSLSKEAR